MDEWILLQQGIVVYLSLIGLLLAGSVGFPIPEDIPLLLAGILIQAGNADPLITFLCCYGGIIAGDLIIFSAGRKFGEKVFEFEWIKKRFPPAKVLHVKAGLERRRFITIFVARHLFYARTLTFLSCGALRMPFQRFIIADMVAAAISTPLILWLGYTFAEHYEMLLEHIETVKVWSLWLLVFLVLYLGYRYFYRKKRSN